MMPHVDEGTLHALLDGAVRSRSPERAAEVEAHLDACEDCRARLRAAESLRGDAAGILASLEPEAELTTPDFGDSRARAKRGSAISTAAAGGGRRRAGVRQARSTRGVAWAASLILALGTGYLIGDLAGPGWSGRSTTASEESQSMEARSGETRSSEATSGQGRSERTADDDRSGAVAPPAAPVTPGAEAQPQVAEPAEGAAPAAETRSGDTAISPAFAAGGEAAKASELERSAPAELDPMTVTGSSAAGEPARGGRARDAVHWTSVTVEEAREALDGPVYLLPRAQLIEISRAEPEEGAAPRVFTLQRLETGVQVRVVQWRGEGLESEVATGDASVSRLLGSVAESEAALPRLQVVRVVRGPYVLELTGPLPEGMLSVLGEVARPAP